MSTGNRREQWAAIAIRQKPTARRREIDIGIFRQFNAERLPVQTAIQNTKAGGIYVDEDAFVFQCRKIKGQAFDLLCIALRDRRRSFSTRLSSSHCQTVLPILEGRKRNNICVHRMHLVAKKGL